MPLSARAQSLVQQVDVPNFRMGDIKKHAKAIKCDHALGLELWSSAGLPARFLAVLILDKKRVDQALVDRLDADLQALPPADQTRVMEWLMANQLTKSAAGKRMMLGWEHSPSALQRRTYWYYQARLRWTGKTPVDNTAALVDAIEARMADEDPRVQWAMNFTAGWIGVYHPDFRARCVALGASIGLYSEEKPVRGCTPNYLPEFIRIEVEKRGT